MPHAPAALPPRDGHPDRDGRVAGADPRATDGAPWVPEGLAEIAAKALARDPGERYASAREMGRALRGFIASSGVSFESAEVADWMRHLFEDRHGEKRAVVAAVEAMELSKIAPVAKAAPIEEEAPAGAATIANEKTKLAKTASKPQPLPTAPAAPDDDDEPVRLPTRTGRYAVAVLALLALAGGGAFAFFRYEGPIRAALGMPASETTTEATDESAVEASATGEEAATEQASDPEAPPPSLPRPRG
ncbi:MAG: hypothetical protein M5U28_29835 [Sandaracinaceae bacterium]|nr:hypothetical protein [Sandaracinaceae bacterium]